MVQPFLPNEADAFHDNQAEPDSVDFEILLLGQRRTGVISGCVVSEDPSTPDMTVDVTAGEALETGEQISVSAALNNTVTAADGSNPRIDLVTINASGSVVVTAGTAAVQPVMPAVPATSVPLAALYVPQSDTSIANDQITDKRVFVADRYVFNVKDFGATGDGTTDDTTAIQAAFDAADAAAQVTHAPAVYFPMGDYTVTSKLTWKGHHILGDGPFVTYITWDAAGGTCIERTGGTVWMKGLRFRGGTGKPDIWLDMITDSTDFGDWLEDLFFDDWNDTTGIAAIRTGSIINCHWRNLRFGGGKGFAIIIKGGTLGTFVLDNFTLDTASAAASVFNGFINVHKTVQGSFQMRVANGRIENSGTEWTDPSGVIWIDSDPINNLGIIPATIHLDNLDIELSGTATIALVHQDTTQTSIGASVTITAVEFNGVLADRPICGGLWSSLVEKPNRPSGVIGLMAVGRFNSGAPEAERTNWWMQSLQLGEYLSMKEAISAPNAEGGTFARIYIPSGLDPKIKFADGTTKELIPKAIEEAGAFTLGWEDSVVNVQSDGGTRAGTVPDNATFDGKNWLVRREGSNQVTLTRSGSDTFSDGDTVKTLDSDGAAIGFFSIGDTEWKIVGTEGTVGGS